MTGVEDLQERVDILSLSNNHQHLPEYRSINERRHLILLEEPTVVCLNEVCHVITEQEELQTQRKPHAFSHYLVANKSLIHPSIRIPRL